MAVVVDYNRDVKPFDDDPGTWSDADIAKQIGGQTLKAIPVGQARQYHLDADWWFLADENVYEGEFQALRDDPGTPAGVKQILRRVWQIIFGVGQDSMNTTPRKKQGGELAVQFSGDLSQMLEWCVTNGSITQESVDNFYRLGGGLKYVEKPAAADVATARSGDDFYQSQMEAVNTINGKAGAAMNAATMPSAVFGRRSGGTFSSTLKPIGRSRSAGLK